MGEMILGLGMFVGLGIFLSLAYVADRPERSGLRWLVLGLVALVDLGLMLVGGSFGLAMLVPGVSDTLRSTYLAALGTEAAAERLVTGLPIFGWLCLAVGLLGLMLLWQPMRRAATRWLPLDPDRIVHAVALQYALYTLVLSAMTAVTLSAAAVGSDSFMNELQGASSVEAITGQFLGFVVLSFLGVGVFVRRDVRAALYRLGLTRRFHGRLWAVATLAGLASAWLVDSAWKVLSPESLAEVTRISEVLFEPLLALGVMGAVLAGVLPGVSEELLFRGAAQPRFGLLATAVLFMIVHTQYTISPALAQILAMGIILGLVRERANTTTAIAVHATYNFTVFMLGM